MTYQPNLLESEWKKPDLTASDLTAYALEMFRIWKWRVRRVNNIPARKGHRGQVQPGWPDIQGYTCNIRSVESYCLPVLCEVKKKGDRMKRAQWDRLQDCHDCGGEAWVCYQDHNGMARLIGFEEWSKTNKPLEK